MTMTRKVVTRCVADGPLSYTDIQRLRDYYGIMLEDRGCLLGWEPENNRWIMIAALERPGEREPIQRFIEGAIPENLDEFNWTWQEFAAVYGTENND